jgi:CBS domain-containing protein
MRARDIMTCPVHTVRTVDSIEDATALLTKESITAAPVVDADGAVVGMVSEGNLLWHRVPADPAVHLWRSVGGEPADRPRTVADVMTGQVVTARPDADVADVAELMLDYDVRSVPVVDQRELVGIVSRRDILRAMVRTDDVLRLDVQHRLDEYAGGTRRWTATVTDATATIDGTYDDAVERRVVAILARTVPGMVSAHLTQPVCPVVTLHHDRVGNAS